MTGDEGQLSDISHTFFKASHSEQYDPGWVKSVGSSRCPESIRQWQYFDRKIQWKYVTADITVRCITGLL